MATIEEITERYPQFAAFFNHPELGPLLQEAADNGYDAVTLQGKLHQTPWWQKNWADIRQLEVLKTTDPAEYWNRYEQTKYEVETLFADLGVNTKDNPNLAGDLANEWMKRGKDDWFLYSELGRLMAKDPSLVSDGGSLAAKKSKYREIASEYLYDFDDGALNNMAVSEWQQRDSEEAIRNRMRLRAIREFGHLEDELKRGMTVRQIASPLINTIAKTLEISPDDIDLGSQKYRQLIDYVDTDSGKRRMMTLTEAERFARRQESFQYTKTARDESHEMALKLMETMGAIEV